MKLVKSVTIEHNDCFFVFKRLDALSQLEYRDEINRLFETIGFDVNSMIYIQARIKAGEDVPLEERIKANPTAMQEIEINKFYLEFLRRNIIDLKGITDEKGNPIKYSEMDDEDFRMVVFSDRFGAVGLNGKYMDTFKVEDSTKKKLENI
jgi:hypothetical protein